MPQLIFLMIMSILKLLQINFHFGKRLILFLLTIYFSLSLGFSQTQGKVVGVTDGDTFTLLTKDKKSIKVRLHGIDTPESNQDFGQKAKEFLSDQIFSKTVSIKEGGNDRYGRLIGIIYLDSLQEGISINEELISNGLAWHYKVYDKNPEWAKLEKEARAKKIGVWSLPNPIPPWEYRKRK